MRSRFAVNGSVGMSRSRDVAGRRDGRLVGQVGAVDRAARHAPGLGEGAFGVRDGRAA